MSNQIPLSTLANYGVLDFVEMAPSLITDNYYEVLEITQTADTTAIKSSYRRLAKLCHPDKRQNDPAATAQFQLVSL